MTTERLPWLRLYVEIMDDEKLLLLAKEDRWDYVSILCLKAKGVLDGDDLVMVRRKVGIKLGVTQVELEQVSRRIAEVGLIDKDTLQPLQWDKRQFVSDQSSRRMRKKRERDAAGDPANPTKKHDYSPEFEAAWVLYPDRPGRNKLESFRAWSARLAQGHSAEAMTEGVRRYAAYCRALGTEPRFIKQPATFFGQDMHFQGEWKAPLASVPAGAGSKAEQRSAWSAAMTGRNGGRDDSADDFIDVSARAI